MKKTKDGCGDLGGMKLEGQARVRTGKAVFLTPSCILQPSGEVFFGGRGQL